MSSAKNKIVIFDIMNYQEQYALCLELIKILEGQRLPEKELVEIIREKISITAGEFDKNRSPRYIELVLCQDLVQIKMRSSAC